MLHIPKLLMLNANAIYLLPIYKNLVGCLNLIHNPKRIVNFIRMSQDLIFINIL